MTRAATRDARCAARVAGREYAWANAVDGFGTGEDNRNRRPVTQLAPAIKAAGPCRFAFRAIARFVPVLRPSVVFRSSTDWTVVMKLGSQSVPCAVAARISAPICRDIPSRTRSKRQQSPRLPGRMDLILICVQVSMSIEPAFRKGQRGRSAESGTSSRRGIRADDGRIVPACRTAARPATILAIRTGVDGEADFDRVDQAERYGTAHQAMASSRRPQVTMSRLLEAAKGGRLPPKLTVQ